jgi:hypothetical protein
MDVAHLSGRRSRKTGWGTEFVGAQRAVPMIARSPTQSDIEKKVRITAHPTIAFVEEI